MYHDCRSSRDDHAPDRKPEPARVNPILPPPPASRKPILSNYGMVDYLSGDAYKTEVSYDNSEPTPYAVPLHSDPNSSSSTTATMSSSPPPCTMNTSTPGFSKQPIYDEPSPVNKSSESLSPAPGDTQSPGILPPPPARFNQRQNFFEEQGMSHSSNRSSSSNDSLLGQTQNLSLNSSTPTKQEKLEDALFKDLLDFAKSKTKPSGPF